MSKSRVFIFDDYLWVNDSRPFCCSLVDPSAQILGSRVENEMAGSPDPGILIKILKESE
jgi:hypothetical protein